MKRIVINSSGFETRVAVLEDGRVATFQVERPEQLSLAGNIYKGRIVRILPGMDAAFVDIGLDRAGFLYVNDVFAAGDEETIDDDEHSVDLDPEEAGKLRETAIRDRRIQDILSVGQDVVVQITRIPVGDKGARVTMHVSLPGRYLVFMPTVDHLGVSRRIDDHDERERLKDILEPFMPRGGGFIIRTVSEGCAPEELEKDANYLIRLWRELQEKGSGQKSPMILYRELTLVERALRDALDADVSEVVLDDAEMVPNLESLIDLYNLTDSCKVILYTREEPVFDQFGIEPSISDAISSKVWLRSGGHIVFDKTEALIAIDVNTGGYTGSRNLEHTIVQTNLEAVREIAVQIRLRNLSGLIIIDLIDMEKQTSRDQVFAALQEAFAKDRARTSILKISEMGLVQMTRKRSHESLQQTLCEPCECCGGRGIQKRAETVCAEIIRQLRRELKYAPSGAGFELKVSPAVANALFEETGGALQEFEKRTGRAVAVEAVTGYHNERFEITAGGL